MAVAVASAAQKGGTVERKFFFGSRGIALESKNNTIDKIRLPFIMTLIRAFQPIAPVPFAAVLSIII